MANYVQIANLAAALIGTQSHITDPDDNRALARAVKSVWDGQRQATLRDGDWNFASERHQVPALADPAPYPYAFQYNLPEGALRLAEVLSPAARAAYRFEGRRILTNHAPPLHIRCIHDVPQPDLWDAEFADAFAKRIAWTIGRRIAGSAYDETAGERTYRAAVAAAKSVDARENPPLEQEECGWIEARASAWTA